MTLQPDDPKLTAYALGELEALEAAAVEAEMADSPALRAEVDAIRALAGELRTELSGEDAPSLTDSQRQAVRAASGKKAGKRAPVFRFWVPLAVAAAAVIAVSAVIPLLETPRRDEPGVPVVMEDQMGPGRAMQDKFEAQKKDSKMRYFAEYKQGEAAGKRHEGLYRGMGKGKDDVSTGLDQPSGGVTGGETLGAEGRVRLGVTSPASAGKPVSGPVAPAMAKRPAPSRTPAGRARRSVPSEEVALAEGRYRGGRGRKRDLVEAKQIVNGRITSEALRAGGGWNTEAYAEVTHNPFVSVATTPLSTFSIDVDTASYANVRRFLNGNQLPPPGAVRIEELVNYFTYDCAPPKADEAPFAVHMDVAGCPWAADHRLVRIGLKGRVIAEEDRPPMNIVFLLDRSGSMKRANKLPLFQKACKLLVERLDEGDTIGIVTYASGSGVELQPTTADRKDEIVKVIDGLRAAGSTNGAAGIVDAYKMARKAFIKGGANRVVLCTDGDFNVGTTSNDQLVNLITREAKSGVFLSVLGFGMGNIKDDRLEKLADKGNGNYAYIDTIDEARKVLVEQMTGTLITIAKDVKIQVEFNPAQAVSYRLIGYENRLLAKEDFNDDTKDAGEIGAGHTVTALYEVVPTGVKDPANPVDKLKYQKDGAKLTDAGKTSGELLTVKLRYKLPDESVSKLLSVPVTDKGGTFNAAS